MRRLAWFACGFAAACLLGCYGGPVLAAGLISAALAILFCAVWQVTRPKAGEPPRCSRKTRRNVLYQLARRGLALCLGLAAALAWFESYSALFFKPSERLIGDEVNLSGQVATYPQATSIGGCSMTVRLDGGFFTPDAQVYATQDWSGLKPGDHVTFTARVRPSTSLRGEETAYYTARGVYLLAYCSKAPEMIPAPSVPVRYWPAWCAEKLRMGIHAAFDETTAPLAVAVTLGDKTELDSGLYSALTRAGLMHAAVVSGLHISYLVGLILLLCGGSRKAALALVPVLLFYALMAGGTPSALRAVLMESALLAAPIVQRENDAPTALGTAVLVLLALNPFSVASVSFQLSFGSVAGILLAAPALSRRFFRALRRLRVRLRTGPGRYVWRLISFAAVSASVSLGAMLFTVPLTALYFGQITLISPVSSILVLWALSLLMCAALVLGTLAVFLPALAVLPGSLAGLLGHYARWAALKLGRFPFASLSADNRFCLIWLGAAYLILLAGYAGRDRVRLPVTLLSLFVLLCAAIGLGELEVRLADLTLAALDVGQGASTTVLMGGQSVLIDCGGTGLHDPGDTAADYFAALGRTRLDLLVLTHFDSDHVNGLEQLFSRMNIDCVAVPGGVPQPEEFRLAELVEAEGAQLITIEETRTFSIGGGSLTLFPSLGGGTSNESGLFALCSVEGFDALVTGDADAFVEKMLIKYYPVPDIELLLVGHHGSKNSSCAEFLRAVRPELAIISVGYNTYGHPAGEVLARLEELGTQVFRTDLDGTVTVAVRNGAVQIF